VKEQGKVFKQLAEAYRGKTVMFPTHTLPPPPVIAAKKVLGAGCWTGWAGKRWAHETESASREASMGRLFTE